MIFSYNRQKNSMNDLSNLKLMEKQISKNIKRIWNLSSNEKIFYGKKFKLRMK